MCSTKQNNTPYANKLKLSGATDPEGQDLLCPSQHTWPLGAELHEQMSRSGGQSDARPPVFKSPSKLDTHLPTHYSRDERLSHLVQVGNITVVWKRDTLPLDH
ncbi:uncharacterized protein TNCV_2611931 [Trichonephila clavipes]|nr:uncharacterized protein TNCV_2611931 [Trichonephila clavipes]